MTGGGGGCGSCRCCYGNSSQAGIWRQQVRKEEAAKTTWGAFKCFLAASCCWSRVIPNYQCGEVRRGLVRAAGAHRSTLNTQREGCLNLWRGKHPRLSLHVHRGRLWQISFYLLLPEKCVQHRRVERLLWEMEDGVECVSIRLRLAFRNTVVFAIKKIYICFFLDSCAYKNMAQRISRFIRNTTFPFIKWVNGFISTNIYLLFGQVVSTPAFAVGKWGFDWSGVKPDPWKDQPKESYYFI